MSKLAVLSLLWGSASAQIICKNDENFLASATFMTGFGPDRTCGEWKTSHFGDLAQSFQTCLSGVAIELVNITGEYSMPRAQLLMYLASPASSGTGGCCGESAEGSACSPFEEMFLTEEEGSCGRYESYPDTPTKSEDGVCWPCWERWDEEKKECMSCWGADAEGCSRSECTEDIGFWDDENDMCRTCSLSSPHGCPEDMCLGFGGMWDKWDDECRMCRPEVMDYSGCSESTCREDGHKWDSWEEAGEMRGYCSVCAPDQGRLEGCGESECRGAMADLPVNWKCWSEEYCRCGFCDVDGSLDRGDHEMCSQDQCVRTDRAPDVVWREEEHGGSGQCRRCFKDGDRSDTNGCMGEDQCEAVEGFVWSRDFNRCDECWWDERFYGCPDQGSCTEKGGHWCGTHCTRAEDCREEPPAPGPEPGQPGQCTTVARSGVTRAESMGYRPRYC